MKSHGIDEREHADLDPSIYEEQQQIEANIRAKAEEDAKEDAASMETIMKLVSLEKDSQSERTREDHPRAAKVHKEHGSRYDDVEETKRYKANEKARIANEKAAKKRRQDKRETKLSEDAKSATPILDSISALGSGGNETRLMEVGANGNLIDTIPTLGTTQQPTTMRRLPDGNVEPVAPTGHASPFNLPPSPLPEGLPHFSDAQGFDPENDQLPPALEAAVPPPMPATFDSSAQASVDSAAPTSQDDGSHLSMEQLLHEVSASDRSKAHPEPLLEVTPPR
jgi:hypothetical protein